MGRAVCYLVVALLLGYLSLSARDEAFWANLAAQKPEQSHGSLAAVGHLFGRTMLFVHDTLGPSQTVVVFGVAAVISACLCVSAIATTGKKN